MRQHKKMKIKKDKYDKRYYIHITKHSFVHSVNEWKQIFGNWNWYSFTFIHIYAERDFFAGGYEFEFVILGLGFRFRYNDKKARAKFKEWDKEIRELGTVKKSKK